MSQKKLSEQIREDIRLIYHKLEFMQMTIDTFDDRLLALEEAVGQEVEVNNCFNLEPWDDE